MSPNYAEIKGPSGQMSFPILRILIRTGQPFPFLNTAYLHSTRLAPPRPRFPSGVQRKSWIRNHFHGFFLQRSMAVEKRLKPFEIIRCPVTHG
jgi:hypothetical protein